MSSPETQPPGTGQVPALPRSDDVMVQPSAARERARVGLHSDDDDERAAALWTLGKALFEDGEIADACETLEAALSMSTSEARRRQVSGTLAFALAKAGRSAEATAVLDTAIVASEGVERGRLLNQRGLLFYERGDYAQAEAALCAAIPLLRSGGDWEALTRSVLNLGTMLSFDGRLVAAEQYFEEAIALAEQTGQRLMHACAVGNLGYAAGRRGQRLQSIEILTKAEALLRALGETSLALVNVLFDRAEVLTEIGLFDDALAALDEALRLADAGGNESQSAQARLHLSIALARSGRGEEAADQLRQAARRFSAADQYVWGLRCDLVEAEFALGEEAGETELLELAHRLSEAGRTTDAVIALLLAGRAVCAGRPLASSAAPIAAACAAAVTRTESQLEKAGLSAVAAAISGGPRTAVVAAIAALRESVLDISSSAAGAGGIGALLSWLPQHAARIAARDGMRHRVRSIGELVAASSAPVRPTSATTGASRPRRPTVVALGALQRSVAPGTALVQFVDAASALLACVIEGGRFDLIELPRLDGPLVRHHQMLLRRMATGTAQALEVTGYHDTVDQLRGSLEELLSATADKRLVVLPSASTLGLAWSAVAGRSRPLAIAESGNAWVRSMRRPDRQPDRQGHRLGVIGSAQVPLARREAQTIEEIYGTADAMVDVDASTSTLRAAMRRPGLLHVACHGVYRSDNPWFSSFLASDGEVAVHEFAGRPVGPTVVVLASCRASGAHAAERGRTTLGTAWLLATLGTRSVIGPTTDVHDVATFSFMSSFHHALADGSDTVAALAVARIAAERSGDPTAIGVADSFLHVGAPSRGLRTRKRTA